METNKNENTIRNNSRYTEKQQGKGERKTDLTPKPEIGRKQREQQSGERAKPQNCYTKPEQPACSGFFYSMK